MIRHVNIYPGETKFFELFRAETRENRRFQLLGHSRGDDGSETWARLAAEQSGLQAKGQDAHYKSCAYPALPSTFGR